MKPTRRPTSSPEARAHASLAGVARELAALEERLVELEDAMRVAIDRVPIDRRESAKNLVHYVALRQHDLRSLQIELSQLGLSSLGRSESCVRASLLEVSTRVEEALAVRGETGAKRALARLQRARTYATSWDAAKHLLHKQTHDVLGPRPDDRHIYVMVTAPSAHEADRAWMVKLLRAGMNVLRINCAHEGPAQWGRMVAALSDARRDTGKECRVLMDLAGPKIRTGPIAGARHVATWKPAKDDAGAVTAPARVVLRRASAPIDDAPAPVLLLRDDLFHTLKRGDELRLRDARGKRRALTVAEIHGNHVVALATRTAYVVEKTRLRVVRDGKRVAAGPLVVDGEPDASIEVRVGDSLVLHARPVPGTAAARARDGRVLVPAAISCTLPAALDHLDVGHRVLFDDGKIGAIVEGVSKKRGYVLRVVRAQKTTVKLRAEKGINLPDTVTTVPSLTEDDRRALAFVAKHADAVSLSFVRRPEDVRMLHEALDALGRTDIGVVLKIETRAGFENLPRLLLEGLHRPPLAVMIARGDLAVEVGFERLAEIQEEILWLCEACHVPAIWATQVLDTLARTGVPSRAEVTDASASVAAECVMLNKGPFVDDAVRVLSDILRRMEKHRYKKRSLFRKLRVSTFVDSSAR